MIVSAIVLTVKIAGILSQPEKNVYYKVKLTYLEWLHLD